MSSVSLWAIISFLFHIGSFCIEDECVHRSMLARLIKHLDEQVL